MGAEGSKNEGLQAARAIAALCVAYFHSYVAVRSLFPEQAWAPIPWLKEWGFLGVNFFFAISGYVICMVVSKPGFTVRSFAIKRVFRLYPMYWVTMAMVIVLIAWGKYRIEPVDHFLYSMTLLPQPQPPAYDMSWTLEREMVFYALAAIVVPILGITGLAATLAALALTGWYLGNPWSFHLLSTVQADFLAGVLAFQAQPVLRRLGAALPICAGGVLLWYTRAHDFPFAIAISMGMIVSGFVNLSMPASRIPFRWLVAVGNASYSVYLLHYIVFLVSQVIAIQWIGLKLPDWACEPYRLAIIVICCLISYVTWQLIERPMIARGNQIADAGPPLRPAKAED
jgi:exopolysaccharide production protein ExoZ